MTTPFQDSTSKSDALKILGLNEDATTEEICSARKRLALLYHPDLGGDTHRMLEVNIAADGLLETHWDVLDPTAGKIWLEPRFDEKEVGVIQYVFVAAVLPFLLVLAAVVAMTLIFMS